MSGRTDFFTITIIAVSLVAVLTDVLRGRIYNWLTLPALAAGLVASFSVGGLATGGDALLGAGAGLALYGWIFFLGFMGGGDVKLLMALGAWGGLRFAVETALLGVLLGGLMSVGMLAVHGRLRDFARRMHRFLLTLFVKELEIETPQVDRKLTMPYGIPIAAAAIWIVLGDPFLRWGMRLW